MEYYNLPQTNLKVSKVALGCMRIASKLQTDYLDILLLHRPDALMDPQEVSEAFD